MVANLDLDGCERPTVSLLDVALSAATDVRQKHAKANRQCVSGGHAVCIPFVTRCWALGCLCRGSRGGQGADCFFWASVQPARVGALGFGFAEPPLFVMGLLGTLRTAPTTWTTCVLCTSWAFGGWLPPLFLLLAVPVGLDGGSGRHARVCSKQRELQQHLVDPLGK